jgi:predicted alpha/beta hydrolase family esterase
MDTKILLAPGFGNSGEGHWQTYWQNEHADYIRVEQSDWYRPVADEWADSLERYVRETSGEVVVVAHSLGCLALAHWAQRTNLPIKGALMVAPPDINNEKLKGVVQGFPSLPMTKLPFKSIVVASTDDEYNPIERAHQFAQGWGSEFVNVGSLGHINAQSGIGNWPEGMHYLNRLLQSDSENPEKAG